MSARLFCKCSNINDAKVQGKALAIDPEGKKPLFLRGIRIQNITDFFV